MTQSVYFATLCYRTDPQKIINWAESKAKELGWQSKSKVGIQVNCGWVEVARARLTRAFLEDSDCEWLFFRDDDITISTDSLKRLIELEGVAKVAPYLVRGSKRFDIVCRDGIIEFAGLGCCAIHREVVEKLWKIHDEESNFLEDDGRCVGLFDHLYTSYVDGQRRRVKEDHSFWFRVRNAGYKMTALTPVTTVHAGILGNFKCISGDNHVLQSE